MALFDPAELAALRAECSPLVTVIVPTIGRATLRQTLAALREQARAEEVEILVVGDSHAETFRAALTSVPALCREYGARYVLHDGDAHAWGHPQRNYGMTQATGQWLMFSQDDDRWGSDAWALIRAALADAPRVPHIFQVRTWQAGVVPVGRTLHEGNVDADGLCAPNDPARLGAWPSEYTGDWAFIRDTVACYGGAYRIVPAVVALGRPAEVPA